MSRRCKPGQRARFVRGRNKGRIVLVVKALYTNEFDGSTWPEAIFPWAVTALGAPLRTINLGTQIENPPTMTMCCCDMDLEPLNDEDDGLTRSARKDLPVAQPEARLAETPTST